MGNILRKRIRRKHGILKSGSLVPLFPVLALSAWLFLQSGFAQEDPTDPITAYNKAVSDIQLEKWDEGLKSVNGVIAGHGENAMEKYGPVFGHFYFLKGILQIGKEDYEGAIASFQTCYEKYSNEIFDQKSREETADLQRNQFRNAALVQWANAEMEREGYAAARDLFEKALEAGAKDNKVNRVHVAVNLGRCYLKAGDLEKGYEFMSNPLSNDKVRDSLRKTIFMVIAEDWSPEKEFPPVRQFLQQFGDIVDVAPFEERLERNPRFQYLAQVAIQKNDPVRALAWYERMIDPRELRSDYEKQYAQLENRKVAEELEGKKSEALAEIRKSIDELEPAYLNILNGIGSAHFLMQNYSGSYVAFSRLSDQAGKDHPERPVFLHNAVVSGAQIERWKDAYRYGREFLDEFPDDELKPGVARVLVEVLFLREEYEDAYKVSGEVRADMEPGAEIRDIPDFVYGASAFHLGHMEESESVLEAYVKDYPEGERLELVRFFLGLAKVQLGKWEDAAAIMNAFLIDYPDSPMTSTVLFQCAMSEFMLDLQEESLVKLDRIHNEFPGADSTGSAWNLKGDIFSSQERPFEEIETAYLNARQFATEGAQPEVAAYALWQLVIQTSDSEMWGKADEHYNEFQEKYETSDFKYDLLTAALPVLVQQGRKDEARDRLRAIVWEQRDQPESSILAEMFGTFVDFVKENYEDEEFIAAMEDLSNQRESTPALRGWVTVALTDFLEAKEVAQEEINKHWYRLEAGFDPSVNSNFPTVMLARWIAQVRKKPEQAKPLYDYILENRPGTPNYEYCLIDVAELQAATDDPAQREEAMEKFQRVLNEFPVEELREKAVLGMARIRMEEENYVEAQALWEEYLETREWTLSRPEANYQLGYAMEKQGNTSDALKIYVSVYANFPGYLDWSTRAYLRTAAITKGRGQDLQALKILQDMLKRMGHHDHPGVKKGKQLFVKWRSEYQPAPEEQKG